MSFSIMPYSWWFHLCESPNYHCSALMCHQCFLPGEQCGWEQKEYKGPAKGILPLGTPLLQRHSYTTSSLNACPGLLCRSSAMACINMGRERIDLHNINSSQCSQRWAFLCNWLLLKYYAVLLFSYIKLLTVDATFSHTLVKSNKYQIPFESL